MKCRIGMTVLAALAVLGLSSCGEGVKANDATVAASVMTQAAYAGYASSPKDFSLSASADFTGSTYESDASSYDYALSLTFSDQTVVCNGKSYVVNGTINYGYTLTGSSTGETAYHYQCSCLLYSTGFSIVGPDIDHTFTADFKVDTDIAADYESTSGSMSCTYSGTIGDTSITDTTATFTYSY